MPRHIHPAACMASVIVGNCRQSVKTSKGAPSLATRQHSESHIVAQVVPCIPQHGRVCLFCAAALVFTGGVRLSAGKRHASCGIRRVRNDSIHAVHQQPPKYRKSFSLINRHTFINFQTVHYRCPRLRPGCSRDSCLTPLAGRPHPKTSSKPRTTPLFRLITVKKTQLRHEAPRQFVQNPSRADVDFTTRGR